MRDSWHSAVGRRQTDDSPPTTDDSRLKTLLRRAAQAIRRIAGMPDYHAYIAHARRCHPERPPLGEREYFAEYLRARYADGSHRCC